MSGIDRISSELERSGAWGPEQALPAALLPRLGEPPEQPPVAVVLAAGMGSRLGVGTKALAEVAGATLLERTVASLHAAGMEDVVVVVGYEKERVAELVRRRRLPVRLVENDDFLLGNGSSALVGARAAGRRFLLVMVDHLFEPECARRLLQSSAPFALAVDSRPTLCDLEEATKVLVEGSQVVAVDRRLERWNAVDAGLALCSAEVAEVAARSFQAGGQSWNAVKRRWLEEGGEIEAVDLAGLFWTDVDTPVDRRRAERALVARAATKAGDGPVARLLNRRLSRPISLFLLRLGASPAVGTALAFLLGVAGAVLVGLGSVWTVALVAGGILVQLASVVDGVDGEMARASLRRSQLGAFVDSVLDRLVDAAVLASLALAAGLDDVTWALLAAALFGSLMTPLVKAAYEASFRRPLPASPLAAGRDVRLLVAAAAAVSLQPEAGLIGLAALANAEAAWRAIRGARAGRSQPARRQA